MSSMVAKSKSIESLLGSSPHANIVDVLFADVGISSSINLIYLVICEEYEIELYYMHAM